MLLFTEVGRISPLPGCLHIGATWDGVPCVAPVSPWDMFPASTTTGSNAIAVLSNTHVSNRLVRTDIHSPNAQSQDVRAGMPFMNCAMDFAPHRSDVFQLGTLSIVAIR